jgi:zinc finger protein
MSFNCPHCGFNNTEIQSAGEIQQQGHKYTFRVEDTADLSRQIIKSDTCIFRVEEIDLEVPPGRGQLSNVEGLLSTIAEDLNVKQEERKEKTPDIFEKIDGFLKTLKSMVDGARLPFTITVDDPAGNSSIEPSPTDAQGKYTRRDYNRTPTQNMSLGLSAQSDEPEGSTMRPEYHPQHMFPADSAEGMVNNVDDDIIENQIYEFPASCPGCMRHCTTNMKMVNIPHFKQVVLMSTVCDACGYRSNEVKTGGAVPEKGRRIIVKVKTTEDLSRDILKAESCSMSCPELALSVEPGTLGGRFTTIEGLLTQVRDDLKSSIFGDAEDGGDSAVTAEKGRWTEFFAKLDTAILGNMPFTVILEDPLAGSYVQSLSDVDGELDENLTMEEYERTAEEEGELGLTDMKTEGYEDTAAVANGVEKEKTNGFADS